jgi:sugar phosphate isomerase/epimerase
MKLGIGSYTYMWSIGVPGAEPTSPMSALDLLRKARDFAVKVVQYGPNLSLLDLPEPEVAEIIRLAREWKIEIEIGMRGFALDDVRRHVELCLRAGATLLRTVSSYQLSEPVPGESELQDVLAHLAPELAAARVCLAIENSTIPAGLMARVLDGLASPWLGITLDTVNSLAIPEGTECVARTLARHVRSLHVKDFAIERVWHLMGFTVEGRPAGQGQLNVPWLLELLEREGATGNAVLELWVPRRETIEQTVALEHAWAMESIEYLRRFIPPHERRQGETHVG